MIPALKAWGPAVLWAAVLFLLSEVSGVSVRVDVPFLDKAAHLFLFGVLGGSLAWGRRTGRGSPPHGVLLALGVAYGALDEWHQGFVPGRSPDPWDLLADVTGVLAGYGLMWWLGRAGEPGPLRGPNRTVTRTRDDEPLP